VPCGFGPLAASGRRLSGAVWTAYWLFFYERGVPRRSMRRAFAADAVGARTKSRGLIAPAGRARAASPANPAGWPAVISFQLGHSRLCLSVVERGSFRRAGSARAAKVLWSVRTGLNRLRGVESVSRDRRPSDWPARLARPGGIRLNHRPRRRRSPPYRGRCRHSAHPGLTGVG